MNETDQTRSVMLIASLEHVVAERNEARAERDAANATIESLRAERDEARAAVKWLKAELDYARSPEGRAPF